MSRIALGLGSLSLAGAAALTPLSQAAQVSPVPGYGWPLTPGPDRIVRDFDPPAKPWLAGNRGVDLLGRPGERVHASGSGVVTFAGRVAGIGVVTISSGPLRTTYEPLRVTVAVGERVAAGDVIGTLRSGSSHCAPRTCLHWGLLRGSDYLDPLALLGLEQVRLLPVDPAGA